MYLLTQLACLTGLFSVSQALSPSDLGYWDVNITSIRSAQGYEAQHTWVVYSGNPDKTIYDEWAFNPATGNITTLRNYRNFHISVDGICGIGPSIVTIKQTVDDGKRAYWLVGAANATFAINPVTGRGGTASVRVNATLDDSAVDVCGRPLNHEPS